MIKKISDLIYLCTPLACFDALLLDEGTVEVTHYKPFVQHKLLQVLLGDEVKVTHKNSVDVFAIEGVKSGVNDGTVHGCLVAFKEYLKANMEEFVSPEELDFSLSVSASGQVSTSSPIVTAMQDQAMLPTQLMSIMDMLTYRLPVYQAYEKASEGYTKFVEPNLYRLFVETAIGSFERNDLFGSYSIKSEAVQGFVIDYLHKQGTQCAEVVSDGSGSSLNACECAEECSGHVDCDKEAEG